MTFSGKCGCQEAVMQPSLRKRPLPSYLLLWLPVTGTGCSFGSWSEEAPPPSLLCAVCWRGRAAWGDGSLSGQISGCPGMEPGRTQPAPSHSAVPGTRTASPPGEGRQASRESGGHQKIELPKRQGLRLPPLVCLVT